MKTLIIYLSETGNTKRLASTIAGQLEDVDLLPIELKTKIPKRHFWMILKFGILMRMKNGFRYDLASVDINAYDQFVIGTPVWMGRAAPPVVNVINNLGISEKVNGVFITCGSAPGYVFEDISQRTQITDLKNRLALSDSDSYDDPLIGDKIVAFIHNIKATRSLEVKDFVYEG